MDLLAQAKSFTIHQRNIQSLAIKLLNVKRNLWNVIMCNIPKIFHTDFQFMVINRFCERLHSTRRYCLNSLGYFASKVCDTIPSEIKNINYLQKIKTDIRKWAPENFFVCLSKL